MSFRVANDFLKGGVLSSLVSRRRACTQVATRCRSQLRPLLAVAPVSRSPSSIKLQPAFTNFGLRSYSYNLGVASRVAESSESTGVSDCAKMAGTPYKASPSNRSSASPSKRSTRMVVKSDTKTSRRGSLRAQKPQAVFVIGGPGAGKGTLCDRLVKRQGWMHLSAGDLLRAEKARPDSELGALINERMQAGKIVPSEITVRLLKNAMQDMTMANKFLIDGFPRSDENIEAWESVVGNDVDLKFVLIMNADNDAMEKRLLGRAQTSGRADDDIAVIRKRLKTHEETTGYIIDYYSKKNLLKNVDANQTIDEVWSCCEPIFAAVH